MYVALSTHKQSWCVLQAHTTNIEIIHIHVVLEVWLHFGYIAHFSLLEYLVRIMLLLFFVFVFANMMFVLIGFDLLLMSYFCVFGFWVLCSFVIYILLFFFSTTMTQCSDFSSKHHALDFVWFMCCVFNFSYFPFVFLLDILKFIIFLSHGIMFMIEEVLGA